MDPSIFNKHGDHTDDGKLKIDDIKASSSHWSLANDLKLLDTIKEISDDLVTKSDDTYKKLDQLFYDSSARTIKVNNVINEFQMIANKQFVENRVKEEEISDPSCHDTSYLNDQDSNNLIKEDKENQLVNKIKKCLETDFKFIEDNFEYVSSPALNNSLADSDDEHIAEQNLIFDINNAINNNKYKKNKLPHIIGTDEFLNDSPFETKIESNNNVDAKNDYDDDKYSDEDLEISPPSSPSPPLSPLQSPSKYKGDSLIGDHNSSDDDLFKVVRNDSSSSSNIANIKNIDKETFGGKTNRYSLLDNNDHKDIPKKKVKIHDNTDSNKKETDNPIKSSKSNINLLSSQSFKDQLASILGERSNNTNNDITPLNKKDVDEYYSGSDDDDMFEDNNNKEPIKSNLENIEKSNLGLSKNNKDSESSSSLFQKKKSQLPDLNSLMNTIDDDESEEDNLFNITKTIVENKSKKLVIPDNVGKPNDDKDNLLSKRINVKNNEKTSKKSSRELPKFERDVTVNKNSIETKSQMVLSSSESDDDLFNMIKCNTKNIKDSLKKKDSVKPEPEYMKKYILFSDDTDNEDAGINKIKSKKVSIIENSNVKPKPNTESSKEFNLNVEVKKQNSEIVNKENDTTISKKIKPTGSGNNQSNHLSDNSSDEQFDTMNKDKNKLLFKNKLESALSKNKGFTGFVKKDVITPQAYSSNDFETSSTSKSAKNLLDDDDNLFIKSKVPSANKSSPNTFAKSSSILDNNKSQNDKKNPDTSKSSNIKSKLCSDSDDDELFTRKTTTKTKKVEHTNTTSQTTEKKIDIKSKNTIKESNHDTYFNTSSTSNTLDNNMIKSRVRLANQRKKRMPARKPQSAFSDDNKLPPKPKKEIKSVIDSAIETKSDSLKLQESLFDDNEDDLFKLGKNKQTPNPPTSKSEVKNFLNDDSSIFYSNTKSSNKSNSNVMSIKQDQSPLKKTSIFDDEDDIFSPINKTTQQSGKNVTQKSNLAKLSEKKSSIKATKEPNKNSSTTKKKSIFDDDDEDDDDLFSRRNRK